MTKYKTTVYALPNIQTTGNGLIEFTDPDDEMNVIMVLDVEEAEILLIELDPLVDTARANRHALILERRRNA